MHAWIHPYPHANKVQQKATLENITWLCLFSCLGYEPCEAMLSCVGSLLHQYPQTTTPDDALDILLFAPPTFRNKVAVLRSAGAARNSKPAFP